MSTADAHLGPADVIDFAEGACTAERHREVEQHLADCAACHAMFAEVVRSPHDEDEAPAPVQVGRFVVLRSVGAGAMGLVFEAYDPQLDRRVALKLRRGRHDPQLEDRLLHEARTMAKLSHPNIVTVHEVGVAGETLFLVMEFIEGRSLRAFSLERRQSVAEVLQTFVQAGHGLAAAHAAGVVHRDFKPENVLVDSGGRARVTDFGLAVLNDEHSVAGTPVYMAPEVLAGSPATTASDQFSFCVALYEALAGRRPWEGPSEKEREWPAPRLPAARAPLAVRRAIERGLSAAADQRFPTMGELLKALEPRRSRALPIVLASALGVAAVALGFSVVELRRHRCNGVEAMQAVWGPAERSQLSAVAPDVVAPLEVWATLWADEYRSMCEAGAREADVRPVQEGRMRCLDERLRDAAAVLRLVREAPSTGSRLVPTLPEPAVCRAASPIGSWRAATVDDATLERLNAQLSEAVALREAGLVREAVSRVDAILSAVDENSAPELVSRAWYERALLVRAGNVNEADRLLLRVFQQSLKAGDDQLATLSAMARSRTVGAFGGRTAEALSQVEIARGLMERLPAQHRYVTGFHWIWGEALVRAERFGEAETVLLEGLRRANSPGSHQYKHLIEYGLADLYFSQGRWDDALTHARGTLSLVAQRVPAGAPGLVQYKVAVALALLFRWGVNDEATKLLDDAARALDGKPESEVPALWATLLSARALEARGRGAFTESVDFTERSGRHYRQVYPNREAETACDLAYARLLADDLAGARTSVQTATALPLDGSTRAWCSVVDAMVARTSNSPLKSLEGVAIDTVALPRRLLAELERGELSLATGAIEPAQTVCTKASEQLARTPMSPQVTGEVSFFCARVARAAHDDAVAATLFEAAAPVFTTGLMPARARARFEEARSGRLDAKAPAPCAPGVERGASGCTGSTTRDRQR